MSLIPDGVYKICNVQFSECVGLGSNPSGPPCAGKDDIHKEWFIKNVGDNEVAIQNVFYGTYIIPPPQCPNKAWTLINEGSGRFLIGCPNIDIFWRLGGPGGCVMFSPLIVPYPEDMLWSFVPV